MNRRYWIPAAILAALCLICVALLLGRTLPANPPKPPPTVAPSASAKHSPAPTPAETAPVPSETPAPDVSASPEPTPEPTPEPYVSPIDFEALLAESPDICGWLEIPGTEISYPVLQNAVDDTYYLDRDEHGWYTANGSLFTEHQYNARDFSDTVTLIYGHHMRDGAMFGNLQATYSDPEQFSELNRFFIYLPDREIEYEVFAAVPYDAVHILYTYDFSSARTFRYFFDDVLSTRVLGANVIPDYELDYDDHIVVLSTCLIGNNKRRFLVMGKEITE